MKKLLSFLLFLVPFVGTTQSSTNNGCPNANFSLGNFTGWLGSTGSCCPINTPTVGIVNGRHTIMTGGTDPQTGNVLTQVAPNYQFSARVGNSGTGAQGEALSYTLAVNNSNSLFIYNFAVVLEDPGHSPSEQPRFEIRVRNSTGQIVPCTLYEVTAGGNIAGFQNFGGNRWRNWTQVGIDLSAYIGQQVTIEIRTGDCSLGGHFGYAYIVADCRPQRLRVDYCPNGNIATLTAPSGFSSYSWNTNPIQTTQSITINNPSQLLNNVFTCTLTSVTGCSATISDTLQPIIVTAGFNYQVLCNQNVSFVNTSFTNTLNSFIDYILVDYGDGTPTQNIPIGFNTVSFNHQYATNGNYIVKLIAFSNGGCTDTIIDTVQVLLDPIADFSFPLDVCGTIKPTTNLSQNYTSQSWYVNSVLVSTAVSPILNLNQGLNDIKLVVNGNGCSDSITKSITVQPKPTANIQLSDLCLNETELITTTNTLDSNIWIIGNTFPVTGDTIVYVGDSVKSDIITLITINQFGCSDTISRLINVNPLPRVDFISDTVCFGFPITFVNNTTNLATNTYIWGNTSTSTNLTLNYPTTINSVMSLQATNIITGCSNTISKPFAVVPNPTANFSATPLDGCAPLRVTFTDSSSANIGNLTQFIWNFGNGTTSNLQNPFNQYTINGTYTVSLIVQNSFGCLDTITEPNYITVYPNPTASFNYSPTDLNEVYSGTQFINLSVGGNTYSWDFGDGESSTLENPYHDFPRDTGKYTVLLTVISINGCVDTVSGVVHIKPTYTIFIPNSFTPNMDEVNETFKIYGKGIVEVDLFIFDRWGSPITHLRNMEAVQKGWDGTKNGVNVKQDVYVYKALIRDVFGFIHEYYGQINLIR